MAFLDVANIMGVAFLIASAGFILFAHKFYVLRNVVYLSIRDVSEILVLIADYDSVETPEFHLARMLEMSPEEVRIEIEKGKLMALISQAATNVLENLKESVPEAKRIIDPVECNIKFGNKECSK